MPHPKRRFEALEDRRLLAIWTGPSLAAPSAGSPAADVSTAALPTAANGAAANGAAASGATASAPTSSSTATADQSASPSDGDSSDNYGGYGSYVESAPTAPSPSASSASNAASSSYSSASYDNSSANEYTTSPTYTPKTPSVSQPSTQPASVTLALLSASDAAAAQLKALSSESFAINLIGSNAGPPSSSSPPVARSNDGNLTGPALKVPLAVDEPAVPTIIDAEAALVALADAPSDWSRLAARTAAVEELVARAEDVALDADTRPAGLITGPAGINLAAIEGGIDEVFDRLDRLGEQLVETAGASRFGQWLIVAAGACAAFEYARARYREGGPWQTAGSWPVLCEPRLRRRWFRRRAP